MGVIDTEDQYKTRLSNFTLSELVNYGDSVIPTLYPQIFLEELLSRVSVIDNELEALKNKMSRVSEVAGELGDIVGED